MEEEEFINPRWTNNKSHSEFRHKLNHDVESIFWLLLYWAMVVQPEGPSSKEKIDALSWVQLNGDHKLRHQLLRGEISSNVTHLFYEPLLMKLEGFVWG